VFFRKQLESLRIAVEKRRDALRRFRWLRPILITVDLILLVADLLLPLVRLVRILLGVGSIAANEVFTPVVVRRILIKDMEANLSFSGDFVTRRFTPLPLREDVLNKHDQRSEWSCIPMAVEFVLKLLGKLPPEDFRLQEAWSNRMDGNFADFDGWAFDDVKFTKHFPQPRDHAFPLDELFSKIEDELAARRYVIISLAVPPHYHNYVIYNRLPNGEFEALTKSQHPDRINDVRARVRDMKGTDILTYEILPA
jgi:hypothetical protein